MNKRTPTRGNFPGPYRMGTAGVLLAAAVTAAVCTAPLMGQTGDGTLLPTLSQGSRQRGFFNRIATFDVPGAVAEIVAASPDGRTLVYTNSEEKQFGFVNISNPSAPSMLGTLTVEGSPTSVAVTPNGRWALGVASDPNQLVIVDMSSRTVVRTIAGNAGEATATRNLLVAINPDGSIAQEIELPSEVNAQQRSNGFEGVATNADGSQAFVAFQREWADDPAGLVKIGRYTPATGEWRFFHYPIDAAPEGAWVGLSEITRLDDTTFAVLERDNQERDNAQVKRIYRFSIAGLTPAPLGGELPVVTKTLARDLLAADDWRLEKAEGLTLLPSGRLLVASDNDGGGETRLLEVAGGS